VPFRLLFNSSVVTGETVPWNEYFAPPPLRPALVIVPISCPVAALNNVSTAAGLLLVASTLKLPVLTTSSALVICTVSTAFGMITVAVCVTPPNEAENVTGVSAATAWNNTGTVENRKSPGCVRAGNVKPAGTGAMAGLLLVS